MSDISVSKKSEEIKAEQLGESLGIAASTVRKYANILYKKGYNFKKNEKEHWIFQEKDFPVLRDFLEIKEKPGVTVELAAEIAVSRKRQQGDDEISLIQPHDTVRAPSEATLRELNSLKSVIYSMKNQIEELEKKRAIDLRNETVNTQLTIHRIKSELRKEALQKWKNEPEEKRMQRTGFIFKKLVENTASKEEFIQDYIDKNLEVRLNSELILD